MKGRAIMYGLNNNTGVGYSQQDNGYLRMRKGINSAKSIKNGMDELSKIAQTAISIVNGTGGIEESGGSISTGNS